MKFLGMDDFDAVTRMGPALFAILPVALLAGVWTGEAWSALAGVATTVGAVLVLPFLLAQLARRAGKQVEAEMVQRMGGAMPTTQALRHGGPLLNEKTRLRYHAFLERLTGEPMPPAQVQQTDPAAADVCYESAVDRLRKHALDIKESMVRTELMAYSFRRNLHGVRPAALAILAVCISANAAALFYAYQGGERLSHSGFLLEIFLLLALVAWLFISRSFVEEASWAYARRLLSLCEGNVQAP